MPNLTTSDGTPIRLTPEQKRILLTLCQEADTYADEKGIDPGSVLPTMKLVHQSAEHYVNPIRETATAAALVRKGLAESRGNSYYRVTTEGYWLGDSLRIEDRQGRIPARRNDSRKRWS